jgi:uncharacterized protein YkwD
MVRDEKMVCIPVLTALGISLGSCSKPELPLPSAPSFYTNLATSKGQVDAAAARDMISIYRRNNNLSVVTIDPELQELAQQQATAMAKADSMSHDVRGTLRARLDGSGYRHGAAVENIAAGYHTLAEAFSGWRQSRSHNENMLNPRMRRMGIAVAHAPQSKFKVYWALIMSD